VDNLILKPEIQAFIERNIGESISKLALQKNPFPEVDWMRILNQIDSKTKAIHKLPTWFAASSIIYPRKISIEQTSSEKAAYYKSSIICGESLIDLTGGFGVDDYFFAKKIKEVAHCELDTELSQIVKHNFKQLHAINISCYTGDSAQTLKTIDRKWDVIYIDPSRRNDAKGKVFMLKDCLPNVPENLAFYFKYSDVIFVKTAPLLDISAGISELKHVKAIHIIAIDNEVKELLWELEASFSGNMAIKTINISKNGTEKFDFIRNNLKTNMPYGLPQKYLYEPNSAIMKSGGFDEVSTFFNINKLHKHSHLYSSNTYKPFAGRTFEIQHIIMYQKTEMKSFLANKQANITTRNFPESVVNIRKKWKIKDGGTIYCFFTTDMNNEKIVLICTKK
jgi:hypothetical protein